MSHPIVLSHLQAAPLLAAHRRGAPRAGTSLDLGLSETEVEITGRGVSFPDGTELPWGDVERLARDAPACFVVEQQSVHRIHRFSTALNRPYTLIATKGAPTLINAGFTMHRIVDVDPHEDTLRKIRALGAPHGTMLDTATGLGYTAIAAARTAQVLTIEIDPLVLEIARLNPWSRALFDNPRLEQRIGDVADVIQTLADEQCTAIMHDPPTVALAGDLYGSAFYRQLFRVLRRGGTLFHYVGNLDSKQGGTVARGVVRRLHEAGFSAVSPCREAFGILAGKPR